jgi:hypothetical protein
MSKCNIVCSSCGSIIRVEDSNLSYDTTRIETCIDCLNKFVLNMVPAL